MYECTKTKFKVGLDGLGKAIFPVHFLNRSGEDRALVPRIPFPDEISGKIIYYIQKFSGPYGGRCFLVSRESSTVSSATRSVSFFLRITDPSPMSGFMNASSRIFARGSYNHCDLDSRSALYRSRRVTLCVISERSRVISSAVAQRFAFAKPRERFPRVP